ncbi:MAG: hypothetical protein K2X74_20770 [Acetobacteraceae bacterium]|nr:hypothetical protein [Acetobacteraceae bacterium]
MGQGWPDTILAFAPALRSCLARADAAAYATQAGPDAAGAVRVLLRAGDAVLECRVAGGAVQGWRILPDAPPPDPAAPVFFLDRRCVDARRVDAPDGSVLGWIAYPGC